MKNPIGNAPFTLSKVFAGTTNDFTKSALNEFLKEKDTVKFVASSKDDLDKACDIIKKYSLIEKCHVYFSPVFGKIEPEEIVDYMINNNMNDIRLQIQMHKVIWDPDKRGV